jgi:hypothetical protein
MTARPGPVSNPRSANSVVMTIVAKTSARTMGPPLRFTTRMRTGSQRQARCHRHIRESVSFCVSPITPWFSTCRCPADPPTRARETLANSREPLANPFIRHDMTIFTDCPRSRPGFAGNYSSHMPPSTTSSAPTMNRPGDESQAEPRRSRGEHRIADEARQMPNRSTIAQVEISSIRRLGRGTRLAAVEQQPGATRTRASAGMRASNPCDRS